MRKTRSKALTLLLLSGLVLPSIAAAQTLPSTIFPVKFVCGSQAPLASNLQAPNEPPVKPGNYATKINVELLSAPSFAGAPLGSITVSFSNGAVVTPTTISFAEQLQMQDFTCQDIVNAAVKGNVFPNGLPKFINGYFNVVAFPKNQFAVTGVYTSQGLLFPPRPLAAPQVDIDVVPQTGIPFTFATGS